MKQTMYIYCYGHSRIRNYRSLSKTEICTSFAYKPDWIEFLKNRNRARMISIVLKDMKREKGMKYKDSFHVAYKNYANAAAKNGSHGSFWGTD